MKITSFINCFEHMSLALQFASISSPAGISLKLQTNVTVKKMIRATPDVLFNVLNNEFEAVFYWLITSSPTVVCHCCAFSRCSF